MQKKRYLVLLFCMIPLCSTLQNLVSAQHYMEFSISSKGSINYYVPSDSPTITPTYLLLGENLAMIPTHWHLPLEDGGLGTQHIAFLDYSMVRTPGKPSIRIEPHTASDVNIARECDGKWYSVKPGDHIIAKVWIYMGESGLGLDSSDIYYGGKLGIDFYAKATLTEEARIDSGYSSATLSGVLDAYPHSGEDHANAQVKWGTQSWTLRTYDFVIPSTNFTEVRLVNAPSGNYGPYELATPIQIQSMVLWMQITPPEDTGLGWFSDAELYINPL